MNTSKISVRYAKALFNLANEEGIADRINEDIKLIYSVCDISEFKILLENPIVIPSRKKEIFSNIFSSQVHELILRFFNLLVKNKREQYLKSISRSFLAVYRKYFGIKSVNLITASPLEGNFNSQIVKIIAENFKSKIDLKKITNPKLIGGFVLQIEDMQYDASISSKLEKIKRTLLEK